MEKMNWFNTPVLEFEEKDTDLFCEFKGFLILGRFLGLVPISGVFRHSHQDLKCRLFSISGLTSILCIALLAFNAGIAFVDWTRSYRRNASDIAHSLGGLIFAFWGLFMYTYFLARGQTFLKIFSAWAKSNFRLKYTKPDKTLKWVIILVSVVMFASTILENAVLHLEYFVEFDHINGHNTMYGEERNANVSFLLMYYWRANSYWNKLIGYHPVLSVLAFINHKLILYGGNYADVFVALFARALYFKFDAMNKVAKETLLKQKPDFEKHDRQAWCQLAKDHESLCYVMDKMNSFFSPIIFVSYIVNIYYFCMQLLQALDPNFTNNSIVHSIYSNWSFLHIILRLLLLSLCLSNVNEKANKTRNIVRCCPDSLFDGPVARLDKKLNTGPSIGFTGLNCFTVTRRFFLSIFNVVFMIEMVLLHK